MAEPRPIKPAHISKPEPLSSNHGSNQKDRPEKSEVIPIADGYYPVQSGGSMCKFGSPRASFLNTAPIGVNRIQRPRGTPASKGT